MTYRFGEFDLDEQRCDCAGLDQSSCSSLWSSISITLLKHRCGCLFTLEALSNVLRRIPRIEFFG